MGEGPEQMEGVALLFPGLELDDSLLLGLWSQRAQEQLLWKQ